MQVHAHKKMIRIYLLDYLENSLQPRLENQYLYPEEQAKYQQAYLRGAGAANACISCR